MPSVVTLLRYTHCRPPRVGVFLDIGCGDGRLCRVLKDYAPRSEVVGLDVWLPTLKRARERECYDAVVLSDASRLPFRDGVFSLSVTLEVLEHLTRARGHLLLAEIERVSCGVVALTTPSRHLERSSESNPFQTHRSAWSVKELRKRKGISS